MAPTTTARRALLLSATLGFASAVTVPEATPVPAAVEVRAPIVTAAPIRFDGRYSYMERRGVIDNLQSGIDKYAKSLGSELGSAIPSFFTDGEISSNYLRSNCVDKASRYPRLVRESPYRH